MSIKQRVHSTATKWRRCSSLNSSPLDTADASEIRLDMVNLADLHVCAYLKYINVSYYYRKREVRMFIYIYIETIDVCICIL